MINSTAFNYVDVLTKAADSSWTREALIANNIANVDTVGYKRHDIDFQSVLSNELGNCKHKSLDSKIDALDVNELNPQVYTDSSNYSYRLDGNNVDIDTESAYLADNQLKYYALLDSMTQEFSRIRSVLQR